MQLRRADLTGRLHTLMSTVDVLICPALPFAAPSIARIAELRTQPGYRARLQRYTVPFNLSGQPTLTLPTGFTSDGLPVAGQLVAANLREDVLVRVGRAFQAVSDWHLRRPPGC